MRAVIAYDTLSRWGGQELITYYMARVLSENGFTVDMVLLFDGPIDRRMRDIPVRRIVNIFETDPRLPARGLLRNILTGIPTIGYDLSINTVYHVMFWPFDIGYLNNPGTYMPPYRLRRRIFIEVNKATLSLVGPRILLTNSKWTLSQLPFRPRMSGVLYPPVVGGCGGESKEDMVVSIGRIAPDKRMEDAVRVMETVHSTYPKASLYIIGLPYVEDYYRKVRAMSRNVEFILDAGEDVKWSYLCRAKVLLHTAVNEHFGLVVAEAQRAGAVPVVHESGGAWSDIVEYGRYGLGYRTLDEAVNRVISLLKNEDLFLRLSEAAKAHSYRFSLGAFKARFMGFVKAALGH